MTSSTQMNIHNMLTLAYILILRTKSWLNSWPISFCFMMKRIILRKSCYFGHLSSLTGSSSKFSKDCRRYKSQVWQYQKSHYTHNLPYFCGVYSALCSVFLVFVFLWQFVCFFGFYLFIYFFDFFFFLIRYKLLFETLLR